MKRRSVVPLEPDQWAAWLSAPVVEAAQMLVPPPVDRFDLADARLTDALLGAMRGFAASASGLRLPTLVLHGTADQLVPLAANRRVYQAFGTRDCVVKLYDGLYHEVFNEPERERVTADLFCWLER